MSREELLERLKEIFIDVFDDEDIALSEDTTASDIDGWDSLSHIVLIGVIEDEFGIKFDMERLSELKNVGSMIDAVLELMK